MKAALASHLSYLKAFIILLCLPIITLTIILYSFSYSIFSRELKNQTLVNQSLFTSSLHRDAQTCKTLKNQLTQLLLSEPFSLNTSPVEVKELMAALYNYTALNPLVSDIYVHFYGDDYFYSNSSSFPTELFYEKHSPVYYNPTEFEELILNTTTPTVTLSSSTESQKTYYWTYPLQKGSYTYGKIIFNLRYSKNPSPINLILPPYNISLIDSNHLDQSFNAINFDTLQPSDIQYIYEQVNSPNLTLEPYLFFELSTHYIYLSKLSPSNLILINLIPFNNTQRILDLLASLCIILILFIIIITILISFYLFDSKQKPFLALKNNHTVLLSQMLETIPMQQHFQLTELISGKITDLDLFKKQSHALQMSFDAPFYTVVIAFSPSVSYQLENFDTSSFEHLQHCRILNIYGLHHTYPHLYIFIIGSNVSLALRHLSLPNCTLYIGHSYNNLLHMSKSYIEASALIDLTFFNTNTDDSNDILLHYQSYTVDFEKSLASQDFSKTTQLLLEIIESVEAISVPFPLRKSIFSYIIMVFYDYLNSNLQFNTYPRFDLIAFYKLSDYESLKEVFLEICGEMLDIIAKSCSYSTNAFSISAIDDYITYHFTKCNFDSSQVANHFGVTTEYAENFYRLNTTQTISYRINHYRIQLAKDLLCTTPYSLKSISTSCGFSHISTFMQVFEEFVNSTPGQFQNTHHTFKK